MDVDPYGKAEKVEDVFSKIKMAREHYEKVCLRADFVNQFITCRSPWRVVGESILAFWGLGSFGGNFGQLSLWRTS